MADVEKLPAKTLGSISIVTAKCGQENQNSSARQKASSHVLCGTSQLV